MCRMGLGSVLAPCVPRNCLVELVASSKEAANQAFAKVSICAAENLGTGNVSRCWNGDRRRGWDDAFVGKGDWMSSTV
jgi:hypothetical protein